MRFHNNKKLLEVSGFYSSVIEDSGLQGYDMVFQFQRLESGILHFFAAQ
jgi:hypothetical protein